MCTLKCTEKRFIHFNPLHFLSYFVTHTEFKGSPEYAPWNVLYHTSLRNYAPFSLEVPSNLSILLGLRWRGGIRATFQPLLQLFVVIRVGLLL
jgi:hypothetical protein